MTDGMLQTGNLLTNYALDLADVNGESLWLCSYYYEATEAFGMRIAQFPKLLDMTGAEKIEEIDIPENTPERIAS